MNNLIRKEIENRLFEIICSEIDICSNARNINMSQLTNSIITKDKVFAALDNLVKSNLIKNVVVDITGRISCQMTIDGLKMFHEKINA